MVAPFQINLIHYNTFLSKKKGVFVTFLIFLSQ